MGCRPDLRRLLHDYQFFISHPTGTIAPPDPNPLLQPLDAAMIAEFETALPTFNASVTNSGIIARSTPRCPCQLPKEKAFGASRRTGPRTVTTTESATPSNTRWRQLPSRVASPAEEEQAAPRLPRPVGW